MENFLYSSTVREKKDMTIGFTNWNRWAARSDLDGLTYPGVYALAISKSDISGTPFGWIPEIAYIGMTNAKGGLKSRLGQFNDTIKGGNGHGGGHRFRFKYSDYEVLIRILYVSIRPFLCDVTSENPDDFRIMGEVAKYEYECFALFVERFGQLPEFNDKKRSPKE